jgi:hypothetical protein
MAGQVNAANYAGAAGAGRTARVFYRIVRSNPPTLRDFLSQAALGIPSRRRDPEALRLRRGISVYATEAQARRKARGMGTLGDYIARIELPTASPVIFERTTESNGHYTLWGDPEAIMACAAAVVPVWPTRPA